MGAGKVLDVVEGGLGKGGGGNGAPWESNLQADMQGVPLWQPSNGKHTMQCCRVYGVLALLLRTAVTDAAYRLLMSRSDREQHAAYACPECFCWRAFVSSLELHVMYSAMHWSHISSGKPRKPW